MNQTQKFFKNENSYAPVNSCEHGDDTLLPLKQNMVKWVTFGL